MAMLDCVLRIGDPRTEGARGQVVPGSIRDSMLQRKRKLHLLDPHSVSTTRARAHDSLNEAISCTSRVRQQKISIFRRRSANSRSACNSQPQKRQR
jgi:hypothetical protein